jgi:nucleotide-binding universal stress UspA family protein
MIAIKNVLVPTDFGDAAGEALRYAREIARNFHASLHVVHVADDIAARAGMGASFPEFLANVATVQRQIEAQGRKQLDALLSDEDRTALHATGVTVTSTDPARAILAYADEVGADLIVSGTHGRSAPMRFLLGSVADRLVRFAKCPVLTLRSPTHDFVHPDALVKSESAS